VTFVGGGEWQLQGPAFVDGATVTVGGVLATGVRVSSNGSLLHATLPPWDVVCGPDDECGYGSPSTSMGSHRLSLRVLGFSCTP
jgi:hypothetical protein